MKISNGNKLWLKVLVGLKSIHIGINKQLVKEKQIKIESMNRSFEIFNANETKSGEVIKYMLLELEINRHMEKINVAVIDLNDTDIFLEYNWLVKHNLEVNWDKETI